MEETEEEEATEAAAAGLVDTQATEEQGSPREHAWQRTRMEPVEAEQVDSPTNQVIHGIEAVASGI